VLVQTYTRSAAAGALAGFCVWALLASRRALAGIVIVCLVLLLAVPGRGREHFFSIFRPSTYAAGGPASSMKARLAAWAYSLELIAAHPLTGVGYGTKISRALYRQHVMREGDPRQVADLTGGNEMQHFHNVWLETGAESGLPAVLALLAFCVARWALLARWFRRAGAAERRRVAAWAAMEAALLVAGLTLYILKYNFGMLTFFVWAYALAEAESCATGEV